mmetsp:Transcript_6696/g.19793  ORF Transcript_6696/g.19793 Transcript_6696/m.19793 type:complete len:198 (+) Transcript_6696:1865-2458(+)
MSSLNFDRPSRYAASTLSGTTEESAFAVYIDFADEGPTERLRRHMRASISGSRTNVSGSVRTMTNGGHLGPPLQSHPQCCGFDTPPADAVQSELLPTGGATPRPGAAPWRGEVTKAEAATGRVADDDSAAAATTRVPPHDRRRTLLIGRDAAEAVAAEAVRGGERGPFAASDREREAWDDIVLRSMEIAKTGREVCT